MRVPGALCLLLLVLAVAPMYAQGNGETQPAPVQLPQEPIDTLKLAAQVVGIAAVVRDRNGLPITSLDKGDFVLKEDGSERSIRYFSQGSNLPLALALLLDTSGSMRPHFGEEAKASKAFFHAMLQRPIDTAAMVRFDQRILKIQYMTNDVVQLERTLEGLERGMPFYPGGTKVYDAITGVSRNVLGRRPGRRAIVILTDGEDNASETSLEQTIAAAQQKDVVVYTVLYGRSLIPALGQSRARAAMQAISADTGGTLFEVTAKMTLEQIYARIAEDMTKSYQVGYTPPDAAPNTYHAIRLTVKEPGLNVQARTGYWSGK